MGAQVEKTRDVLRLLDRAATEHLAWLMRVHERLMFPGHGADPCGAPPLTLLAVCAYGEGEQLAPLMRLRGRMLDLAGDMVNKVAVGVELAPLEYQHFMAAVDGYGREARRVEAHFRRLLVETDPLTGLHNRQGMMRDLRREWTRGLRTGQPACLALADLDFFKQVNDTWGHVAGDKVLCAAAHFFQRRLRPYDSVYRYGGEEFLLCLPNTDAANAAQVLDRLRRTMARLPVTLECGSRVPVTCSIGVAQLVPGRTVHEAVMAADRALYAAKEQGRNRVEMAPAPDAAGDAEADGHGDFALARVRPADEFLRH